MALFRNPQYPRFYHLYPHPYALHHMCIQQNSFEIEAKWMLTAKAMADRSMRSADFAKNTQTREKAHLLTNFIFSLHTFRMNDTFMACHRFGSLSKSTTNKTYERAHIAHTHTWWYHILISRSGQTVERIMQTVSREFRFDCGISSSSAHHANI